MPSKIKILIVEDQPNEALRIESLVHKMGYEILGTVDSAKKALRLIEEVLPDAMIVDININGPLNGIELVENIRELEIPVIFSTGLEEIEVFEKAQRTHPSAYLVKPFNELTFQAALENAICALRKDKESTEEGITEDSEIWLKENFFIKRNNLLQKVRLEDIDYIQSDGNYCDILADKKHVVKMSLTQILKRLPQERFVRIHQRYVIQLDKIESIDINQNELNIKNHVLPIGPSYKDDIYNRLNRIF